MKKLHYIFLILCLASVTIHAQTEEELKASLKLKKDSINAIQGRVDKVKAEIDALPGWKIRAFGTVGMSLSQFDNWYAQGIPNNSSGNIAISFNGIANLKQDQYFWRNSLIANFQWIKLDDESNDDDEGGNPDGDFREAVDVFTLTSLYGYKLTEKLAISTLAEYRTTVLSNFNNPGYLDIGAGFTWTPITDLVVVVHPLNYNFVFSEGEAQYESSLGAKIVADYTRQIGDISFKTNLSAFLSYEDSDYSNWTWTNSFSYTLWKAIGVGFDFGLRNNKQEALNFANSLVEDADPFTLENVDNDLQTYWNFGLSYAF